VVKLLIANKCDCDEKDRKVTSADGKSIADKYGMKFFETSAKMNVNIDEAFSTIAEDIVSGIKENPDRFGGESSGGKKKKQGGAAVTVGRGKKTNQQDKSGCC
jgi:hypothetical protein